MSLTLASLLMSLAGLAHAHKSSDSYLQLNVQPDRLTIRWDIALRDLDAAIDIDTNLDGQLTWGEIQSSWNRIDAYALPRLSVAGCPLRVDRRSLERRNDGAYAVLWLSSSCGLKTAPAISYRLFAEVDPTHRGIARIDREGSDLQLRVLDPHAPSAAAQAHTSSGSAAQAGAPETASSDSASRGGTASFLVEGMHHILGGYDHILFLLCLLLPAVIRKAPGGWKPVTNLWQAVWPVAGIVTAFTVAHSITLGLAALKIVSLPSSFIEPAIAVTIMVAAADNFLNLFHGRRAIVTFFFGLIHGFGFAGVLSELGLPASDFALALLQFNVGLELGQLAIVVVAVSLLYSLRNWSGYKVWVVGGGSLVGGLIGLLWFIERISGMKWLPI